jgi:hypothetical protein
MFDDLGDLELSVKCVSVLRKKYLMYYGNSGGFGNKGILEIDYTHRSYPESLSSL